jgi:flagellar basal-body rod protein FlgB
LKLMQQKMAWDSENHDIISANIANADTPGYKSKELKKIDFGRMAMQESKRLKMATTSGVSLQGDNATQEYRVEKKRKTYETSPVKNNVAIEEQMAQLAYNSNDYQMVTNLYKKTTGMFKTALGQH